MSLNRLALVPLAILLLTSCSTSSKGTASPAYFETQNGAATVNTFTAKARITAIDQPHRKLTLKERGGQQATIKAGTEVRNFDQLQVGDQVKVTIAEEVAVTFRKGGGASGPDGSVALIAAPKGAKPGVVMADTVDVPAKIIGFDAGRRTATFQFADGVTKKLKLGKDVDLTGVRSGDSVQVQVSEAFAIFVDKT